MKFSFFKSHEDKKNNRVFLFFIIAVLIAVGLGPAYYYLPALWPEGEYIAHKSPDNEISLWLYPIGEFSEPDRAAIREQERLSQIYSAGPCYNITPGWVFQRTAWWSMLQKVFSGTDVETALSEYSDIVNSRGNNTKTNGAAGNGKSRVLFISSNAIDYPGVEEQIEGIREALGDDAFLHSNSDNAAEKLDAVLALFNTDIRTEAGDLHITISVGSADFPENASTIEELVQAADKALYYVKGNGRNAYRRYSDIDWR